MSRCQHCGREIREGIWSDCLLCHHLLTVPMPAWPKQVMNRLETTYHQHPDDAFFWVHAMTQFQHGLVWISWTESDRVRNGAFISPHSTLYRALRCLGMDL